MEEGALLGARLQHVCVAGHQNVHPQPPLRDAERLAVAPRHYLYHAAEMRSERAPHEKCISTMTLHDLLYTPCLTLGIADSHSGGRHN